MVRNVLSATANTCGESDDDDDDDDPSPKPVSCCALLFFDDDGNDETALLPPPGVRSLNHLLSPSTLYRLAVPSPYKSPLSSFLNGFTASKIGPVSVYILLMLICVF